MASLFQETNSKGKVAERAVYNHYKGKGFNIVDVSEDKEYQKQDIDLIINGQTVEVKLGAKINQYEELVIELISNADAKWYKAGWFYTTQAQAIIWYCPAEKAMYQITTEDLRLWFSQHANEVRTKLFVVNEFGNVNKPSLIAFIPVARLMTETNSFRKVYVDEI